jgi:hypothetical protein
VYRRSPLHPVMVCRRVFLSTVFKFIHSCLQGQESGSLIFQRVVLTGFIVSSISVGHLNPFECAAQNRHDIADNPSSMHRQHFVDILKQHLSSSCTVHFNKRLIKYDKLSTGSLVLHFADESTITTDVLIGADGVHSLVRKTLFETIDGDIVDPSIVRHYANASWTGTLVYRAIFPAARLSEMDPDNVALKGFVIVSHRQSDYDEQV